MCPGEWAKRPASRYCRTRPGRTVFITPVYARRNFLPRWVAGIVHTSRLFDARLCALLSGIISLFGGFVSKPSGRTGRVVQQTSWTHPWGLPHKIPLVRLAEPLGLHGPSTVERRHSSYPQVQLPFDKSNLVDITKAL